MPPTAHGKKPSKGASIVSGYSIAVAAGSTLAVGGTVTFDVVGAQPNGVAPDSPGALSVKIQGGDGAGAIVWATAGYADRSFVLGPAGHATATLYSLDNATETDYAITEFDVAA